MEQSTLPQMRPSEMARGLAAVTGMDAQVVAAALDETSYAKGIEGGAACESGAADTVEEDAGEGVDDATNERISTTPQVVGGEI